MLQQHCNTGSSPPLGIPAQGQDPPGRRGGNFACWLLVISHLSWQLRRCCNKVIKVKTAQNGPGHRGHGNALYKNAFSAHSSRCNTQICPPLNLCILATLFQEIYLKSKGLSTLFWIKSRTRKFWEIVARFSKKRKNCTEPLSGESINKYFPAKSISN